MNYVIGSVQFYLSFSEKIRIINNEVPVYDGIGLLSSLGGALGLFVGFSFFGYIVTILDAILDKGTFSWFKR